MDYQIEYLLNFCLQGELLAYEAHGGLHQAILNKILETSYSYLWRHLSALHPTIQIKKSIYVHCNCNKIKQYQKRNTFISYSIFAMEMLMQIPQILWKTVNIVMIFVLVMIIYFM